jgi:transposase
LAARLGIDSSGDTILRVISQSSAVHPPDDVKVLGVDDWAWRRGHRYGTVLVDLERRQPIDLLPDRESNTLAEWLQAHPTVQVITRDRAGAYAEGARLGAPEAVQVADRFHLFCNLTQALQRVLERLAGTLRQISLPEPSLSASAAPQDVAPDGHEAAAVQSVEPEAPLRLNLHEQQRLERRGKGKALFERVRAAYQSGLTKRAIARELGITRTTVRRLLRTGEFLERAPRRQRSELDSFRAYLEKRWAEGCHNASQLCRELRNRGYSGKRSRVKEYVQPWRAKVLPVQSKPRRTLPNVRLVAFWLAKSPAQRNSNEQQWVQAVTTAHPQIAAAEHLAQQFRQVFKDRSSNALSSWLERSLESEIPELKPFVTGIHRDYEAVVAAVEQAWSNGQVEGQVHRLKLLKRQMYGRGGFLLLRRRVLPLISLRSERAP